MAAFLPRPSAVCLRRQLSSNVRSQYSAMARHGKSFEEYHSVPEGWDQESVLAAHEALHGTFDLQPMLVPQNYDPWLKYRGALYAIAEGVSSGDRASAELAVRFIELQFVGSYAGFVRELLARRLKHVELTQEQRQRLSAHFLSLLETGVHCQEFHEYLGLWRQFISEAELARVEQLVARRAESRFGSKVLSRLQRRGDK